MYFCLLAKRLERMLAIQVRPYRRQLRSYRESLRHQRDQHPQRILHGLYPAPHPTHTPGKLDVRTQLGRRCFHALRRLRPAHYLFNFVECA